ncbi:MAG TPA: alpha/beta fold hydrolase [Xanthomonadaceae bacterium]|nr:alpha/beta fold hydrolase [Xanthomonadaceae bacterium]
MATVGKQNSTNVRKYFKLLAVRAGFALGSLFAPRHAADRAARLFATPFASSRSRARQATPDAEMHCEPVRVGKQTIATYVWGDPATQPYVLLAHGWSSFGLRFQPWVARLRAAGYAVITFDQPGHGASSGDLCTLPEFVDTVRAVGSRFGNAALAIAHSLGGAAMALAQNEHWRADRIVLIAPSVDIGAAVGRFFRFAHVSERLRPLFYAWHTRRTGVDPATLEIHRIVQALAQPCLVVHDLDDRDVPWDEGERYARFWPQARLLTTTGLRHNRIVDDPGVMAQVLRFAAGETVGEHVVSTSNLPFGMA